MRFRATDWDFICTKRKQEGMYDLMIYNPARKELYSEECIKEQYLRGTDSYGKPYAAAEVSRDTFDTIFEKLFKHNGCHCGFFEEINKEDNTPAKREKKAPEETVLRAIMGELTEDELDKLIQTKPENADYYNYGAFISMISKFKRGEIPKSYFISWSILVSWALSCNRFSENSAKEVLYSNLSDCFDGFSFLDFDEEKEKECREMTARIKYYDHLLKNAIKYDTPPLYNDDGTAVYISFDYFNHHNEHCRFCVADEENEVFRITYVANPMYLENVNYNFIDEEEFDNLKSEYYDFYHDINLDISKYIVELPYLDINGDPVKN